MDFEFTDEQNMLAEQVQRFMTSRYSSETRRAIQKSAAGWSRDVWSELAQMGVVSLLIPSEAGGLGGDAIDTMVVMNAFGQGMLLEPYWSSAVFATVLIRKLGGANAATLLEGLATGERVAAVAHAEPAARYDHDRIQSTAKKTPNGFALTGAKAVVIGGGIADTLLFSARVEGGRADGPSVFAVPRGADGVRVREYRTIDGRAAADITLEGARVDAGALLGAEGGAAGPLEDAHDVALAALCADTVGSMKAMLDATGSYLQTRKQFGQPIGRFQALQHRMADMLIHFEQAKSMAYLASMQCDSKDLATRRKALSAAKVVIGQSGRFIAQQAVQLHGGMGMADELDVSHSFRRITAAELTLGDTDFHLERVVAMNRAEQA
jgi:alkylation response protein AidB-like acyl-CoA dehydrogenase